MRFILILMVGLPFAVANAEIEGLGGFGICADKPESLLPWYKNFGLKFTKEEETGGYTSMAGSKFPFHLGIYPTDGRDPHCKSNGQGFGVNFKVKNFDSFLKRLKSKGIVPIEKPSKANWGCLALFKDSAGNNVSIISAVKTVKNKFICE